MKWRIHSSGVEVKGVIVVVEAASSRGGGRRRLLQTWGNSSHRQVVIIHLWTLKNRSERGLNALTRCFLMPPSHDSAFANDLYRLALFALPVRPSIHPFYSPRYRPGPIEDSFQHTQAERWREGHFSLLFLPSSTGPEMLLS